VRAAPSSTRRCGCWSWRGNACEHVCGCATKGLLEGAEALSDHAGHRHESRSGNRHGQLSEGVRYRTLQEASRYGQTGRPKTLKIDLRALHIDNPIDVEQRLALLLAEKSLERLHGTPRAVEARQRPPAATIAANCPASYEALKRERECTLKRGMADRDGSEDKGVHRVEIPELGERNLHAGLRAARAMLESGLRGRRVRRRCMT
jgi:hypothetical protein